MSARRPGTCQEPGPYDAHCTEPPMHRYACYDAGEDSSWTTWMDRPHRCEDPNCPGNPLPSLGESP